MDSFGERLKQLRINSKMTITDICKAMSISRQTLLYYEKGTNTPSYKRLVQLSELFNVSLDYLVGKSDNFKFEQAMRISNLIDETNININDLETIVRTMCRVPKS